MNKLPLIILALLCKTAVCQLPGTFKGASWYLPTLVLRNDSTFIYTSDYNPHYFHQEPVNEKGRWAVNKDTLILNPHLPALPALESELVESTGRNDDSITLTFNIIRRYYDNTGMLMRSDTGHINRLDYAFNKVNRKNLRRVADRPTTRCGFAGYIPPETITNRNTIRVARTEETLSRIHVFCYELKSKKTFEIHNSAANNLSVNIFYNIYSDGMLRQEKFLIGNRNNIYTHRKASGRFKTKNTLAGDAPVLKRSD